jgi:hypothetical protein
VITLREDCQYTDPPDSLGLLRSRRARPCCRRAANKCDELTPSFDHLVGDSQNTWRDIKAKRFRGGEIKG